MEKLQIEDESYILSPTSAASSSEEIVRQSTFEVKRSKLNAFLKE